MRSVLSLMLCIALSATVASAQTTFRANLDGFQETPPIPGTTAGGFALFTLNPAGTLTYDVRTFGLSATAAHIHKGAPGVAGGIIFPLTGGPVNFSGTTAVLTAAQLTDLRTGQYYVNVHTAAFPAGEIRGQLALSPDTFGARLDNLQEVPANTSTARGDAFITVNPDMSLTYLVTTTGLVGGTNAHIHSGVFGVSGGIEVPLVGGPTVWSGTSAPIGEAELELLQNLGMYVNVHTVSKPAGEIRGQIVRSGELYGPNSNPPTGTIVLRSTGAPTDVGGGGNFTLNISGGKPAGMGSLVLSLGDTAALLKLEPLLVNFGSLLSIVPLPLDGAGGLTLPAVTPALPVTIDVFLQFFGNDATAPNGKFNASNGLKLRLQHF
jgi:hypothetical protein